MNSPETPVVRSSAAHGSESPVIQPSTAAWSGAKEFEWKQGQPTVNMGHRDDGIALLTGVQGPLNPRSEVRIVQNEEGDWLFDGSPEPKRLSGSAVFVPWFGEVERPHTFESWRIEQGAPKLNQMIRQDDGFCAFQTIGGHFRGFGEQYRLLMNDGYWRFNARSQAGGTRARILVVKMTQPGSLRGVVREHHANSDTPEPVRMIHGNDGFAFLAGIGGTFAGDEDYVRVSRHDDGYWYLDVGSSRGDVKAWGMSVQVSKTTTPPPVAIADRPTPSPPPAKTTDAPPQPSKADQAIAALKKLEFDVSEDGHSVEIEFGAGETLGDEDLIPLRDLPDITELSLYDIPVTDKGVQYLSGLSKLQRLKLNNSKITDNGLKVIGGLKSLEEFELGDCERVTGAGLTHLKTLTNLRVLEIFYVKLRPGDLAFVHDLINLETFHFVSNEDAPDESDIEFLGRLTQLSILNLGGAEMLNNGTITHLSKLKSLTDLDLSYTSITDRGMQTVKEFPRLKRLQLRGTRVDDLGVRQLAGMENLRELHLSGSRVGSRGISSLADCPNLEELFLNGPETTDRQLAGVKDLKQLKKLYLSGDYDFREKRSIPTRITLNGIKYVSELEELEFLHLKDNPQITDEAVPFLIKMKNLDTLKLEGTRISPQGGRRIADAIDGLDYDDLEL